MNLHHALPLAPVADQRPRETFASRRMRQRRPIPILVAAVIVWILLPACDITQQHLDQAADHLATATVATGSFPTASQISAAPSLQTSHLAGSNWRMVLRGDWPHARAVASLGTNGRIVWHLATEQESPYRHWRVQGGALELTDDSSNWHTRWPGRRIDANNICCNLGGDQCGIVFQRVTP